MHKNCICIICVTLQPTICEILCVLVEYTKTVTFMWMLMEGVYLHNTLVVAVYSSNPNYIVFYIIGWGEKRKLNKYKSAFFASLRLTTGCEKLIALSTG